MSSPSRENLSKTHQTPFSLSTAPKPSQKPKAPSYEINKTKTSSPEPVNGGGWTIVLSKRNK
jgi:hypothetical protein